MRRRLAHRRHVRPRLAAAIVPVLFLMCVAARTSYAAELVTLRNGFELNCDHRGVPADAAAGQTAPAHVRLYLDPAEANYIDVAPAEIVRVEPLPPAPKASADAAAQPPAKAELTPAELRQLLAAAGAEHDLDVDLLASVVHAESGSNAHAVSRAGAQGLMQLMPATAAQLGVKDSFAPEQNVHGGTGYLDSLLKRYHDNLALALAAYNAGPGAVDRYHGVPPYRETRAYVARIIHEFNQRYAARQAAAALAMTR
jgi:soluble lytic murein transglycosylase-like protein